MIKNKILLLKLFFLLFLFPSISHASFTTKKILILYSFQPRMPAYELLDKNFRDIYLNKDTGVEYFTEYLEQSRFRDEKSIKKQADLINHKYKINKPDIVIAVMSPALDFIQKYCMDTFVKTPVLYALIDEKADRKKLQIKATGVTLQIDLVKTLNAALSVQPETRDVYVVAGTSVLGSSWQAQAKEELGQSYSQLNFHYLSNLSMDKILQTVSKLPPQTIILYLLIVKDVAGKSFVPREALEKISKSSSVPVYGLWDTYVGHGIIGGHLSSFDLLGKNINTMATRILNGENLDEIQPIVLGPNIYMFDWLQMKRFGINEKRIPKESILLFKTQSAWDKYRAYFIVLFLFLFIETLLILILTINIKRRKIAEADLLQQKQFLQKAQEIGKIGTWELDIKNNELLWTEENYKIFGIPIGTKLTYEIFLECVHPEDRNYVDTEWKTAFTGKPYDISHRLIVNNKTKWVREKAELIFNENGQCIKGTGYTQDITEKRQLQVKLQQAQKMESIGTLAGGIAHDFNNLLFPIIGMSEMLLEDLPKDSLEYENATEIYHAGRRAGALVKQILAFSRQSEHKMAPVRVQNVLKEVLKLSRSTIPSNIEIHQDIQQNCGLVLADSIQIHQVAMNLITNAFHAVEEKNGVIDINLKEITLKHNELPDSTLQSGKYIRLSISDDGIGMSQTIIYKIFEPYFTTKTQGKGTGLGLSVVYGIVKSHGGDIKVYSEIGKGTTFSIYLPLMKKSTEIIAVKQESSMATGTENILLVDDEASIAKLEGKMLSRFGYQVTIQTNSIEALNIFKQNPEKYDLVITDMAMPNMTGDHLANEILSIKPDIPIILCTGFSERISNEQVERIGVKCFLMKPVTMSDLTQMVRKVLDENKIS